MEILLEGGKMLKSKIFESLYSDLKIEVLETGWITITNEEEDVSITLGKPENARIELLENALAYARKIIGREK